MVTYLVIGYLAIGLFQFLNFCDTFGEFAVEFEKDLVGAPTWIVKLVYAGFGVLYGLLWPVGLVLWIVSKL